ncbi:hypothetical protein [Kocuria nitroreducens]|uniref:hypothetical protein n=1 Tax=Kocuria nitroreducens TaxID=3058914 RepID=UPI0036DDCFAF
MAAVNTADEEVPAPLHGPCGRIQTWLQADPAGAERLLEEVAYSLSDIERETAEVSREPRA